MSVMTVCRWGSSVDRRARWYLRRYGVVDPVIAALPVYEIGWQPHRNGARGHRTSVGSYVPFANIAVMVAEQIRRRCSDAGTYGPGLLSDAMLMVATADETCGSRNAELCKLPSVL